MQVLDRECNGVKTDLSMVDEAHHTRRPGDILKRFKPTLTPHYFRHNYVTMLYEAGVDPLIAMKIVGHADYQTTREFQTMSFYLLFNLRNLLYLIYFTAVESVV